MKTNFTRACVFAALALVMPSAQGAVKLTALQIISGDANGKIQGVGAHRFRTTNHGGQPCTFVVKGDALDGEIINGPGPSQNGIDIPLSAGTHTFTVYAEKYNSYTWAHYTLNLHFDMSNSAQISAVAPLNTNSTQFFPPFLANKEYTEDIPGHPVLAPNSLLYKSGQVTVTLASYHFSTPTLFNKDRVSPFEAKANNTADYVGQFTLEVVAPPEVAAGGVVNAASITPKIAPGSLFSIFGSSLASGTMAADGATWPTTLGGVSVTVGGKPAPIYFISPGQINAQVPYEVAEAAKVPVVVRVNGVAAQGETTVIAAAPGVFQFGEKRAVVQNQDYTVNTAENGADPGTIVTVYATGSGRLDNPVPNGQPASADPLSRPHGLVAATINGMPAEIVFCGMTPGSIGLMQVNLRIPNLGAGTYPLVISINGEKSNAALITVK